MKYLLLFLVVLSLIPQIGCSPSGPISLDTYQAWIGEEPEELVTTLAQGDYRFQLRYHPPAEMVYRLNPSQSWDSLSWAKALAEQETFQHMSFRILPPEKEGIPLMHRIGNFTEAMQYFAFDAEADCKLVQGLDTLDCVLYHYERTMGTTPHIDISLVFAADVTSFSDYTFLFRDQLLGCGPVNLPLTRFSPALLPYPTF